MRIPLRVDLALHAVPSLALLIDFLFLEPKFSKLQVRYGAPLVVSLAAVSYASWVEYCASFNGSCKQSLLRPCAFVPHTVVCCLVPYPFLENPLEIRLGIYAAAATLALVSFWALNTLHP